ncbi:hypothetical protein QY702_04670 [Xanthomonas campestris pv. plantaginis]|uniref:hypothetical protein n=1 Tax=Xanthomonas campestris TaxID=339 RepID=UPI002B22E020|nr:hypothetical protein [Xanthomonas campestris]MEA9605762.1 hypothetical protein [Xanthomonas campestris pv. plantaginis]
MKRKFVTEYALGYMNSYSAIVAAHQLMQGGHLEKSNQDELDKCHIYIIAAKPTTYFNPNTLKLENDLLSGEIGYKIDGNETRVKFEGYPWRLSEGAVTINCKYPYKEVCSYTAAGEEVRYIPAHMVAHAFTDQNGFGANDLNKYEALYVGQSIGQGNLSAQKRLLSHSTLQKILALTAHDYPDKDIVLLMYQFEHGNVFGSMDGRAKDAINTEENEDRLINAIHNPPNKKQKISLIEAGLIRYFHPPYNEKFKIKFPSVKHKTLKSCYKLDVSALIIELDSSNLNYYLYSKNVPPQDHHIAKFDLVAPQNRQSFFDATNLTPLPDIIKAVER